MEFTIVRKGIWAASAAVVILSSCASKGADAAAGPATPETLVERLEDARDGEVITLAPGHYGEILFPRKMRETPITLEAAGATFSKLKIAYAGGVVVRGGKVVGTGGRSYGIHLDHARNVTITDMTITGAHRGIVVSDSSDVVLKKLMLTGLLSDGINVAQSYRVAVTDNVCRDFNPAPRVFDSNGKMIKDGDHPDCIQGWSRPVAPPTADVVIRGNLAEVNGQGIFFGNKMRNGVDDGGFDRIVIEDNIIKSGFPRGITLNSGRDSSVRNNTVETLPGSTNPRNGQRYRANLYVDGTNTIACGNTVKEFPNNPTTVPCTGE